MNPLAVEFAPWADPAIISSRVAPPSLHQQPEPSGHASLAPANQQKPVGSAPTDRLDDPRLADAYHLALPNDGNSWVARGVGGHCASNDPWNQSPDGQEATQYQSIAPVVLSNGQIASQAPVNTSTLTAAGHGGISRLVPFQADSSLPLALGAGGADSGRSHMTESLAHSLSPMAQRAPAMHYPIPGTQHLSPLHNRKLCHPHEQSAADGTVSTGATMSAPRTDISVVKQVGASSAHPLQQPAHGPETAPSRSPLMPRPETSVPREPGSNAPSTERVSFRLVLGDQDWPPLQAATVRGGSKTQSRSQRHRFNRQPAQARSETTRRQRRPRYVDVRTFFELSDDQDGTPPGTASTQTSFDQDDKLQGSHEHTMQHAQLRIDTQAALPSPAPASAGSAPVPSMELRGQGTSSCSPLQPTSMGSLDRGHLVVPDAPVSRHVESMPQNQVDNHQGSSHSREQGQRYASLRPLRVSQTLAPDVACESSVKAPIRRVTFHSPVQGIELATEQVTQTPRPCPASQRLSVSSRQHAANQQYQHKLDQVSSSALDHQSYVAAVDPQESDEAFGADLLSSSICEPGSWTNSKRWVSDEEQERQAFIKMMTSLRHIGADKSPYLPQNMTELAAFKAEAAEENRKQLTQRVERRIEELEVRKDFLQTVSKGADKGTGKLLWGRRFQDGASPVFASVNCFNEDINGDGHSRVEWPSLDEFKEEGERRGAKFCRCLPLPRLNAVDPRVLGAGTTSIFHPDGTIRWQAKALSPCRALVMPVSPPETETGFEEHDARVFPIEDMEDSPRSRGRFQAISGGLDDE